MAGGWGEIRTHGDVAATPVFKTGALNRSATHPHLARSDTEMRMRGQIRTDAGARTRLPGEVGQALGVERGPDTRPCAADVYKSGGDGGRAASSAAPAQNDAVGCGPSADATGVIGASTTAGSTGCSAGWRPNNRASQPAGEASGGDHDAKPKPSPFHTQLPSPASRNAVRRFAPIRRRPARTLRESRRRPAPTPVRGLGDQLAMILA